MARKPRVMPRVVRAVNPANSLKGATLFQPVTTISEFAGEIGRQTDMMAMQCQREILQAYTHHASPQLRDGEVLDAAAFPNIMKRLLKKLRDQFEKQFRELAAVSVPRMIERTSEDSTRRLRASLRDISETLTLKFDRQPQALKDTFIAASTEATMYIKLVPEKYMTEVEGAVMRSITTGRGLQDLIPALEKQKIEKVRWAKNVAMDQTRKVYNAVNRERMRATGIKKFEWIHSGGSKDPRPYHLFDLNGKIFDIDNPPIIDKKTGERGFPGQLPYCGCTMRPVIEIDEDDG